MFQNLKEHREEIRSEARELYLNAGGEKPAHRHVRAAIKTKFAGILASILIGLAVKLAWALICKWWEDRQENQEIPASYQLGEPGYGDDEG
jgi:hypothetical protein